MDLRRLLILTKVLFLKLFHNSFDPHQNGNNGAENYFRRIHRIINKTPSLFVQPGSFVCNRKVSPNWKELKTSHLFTICLIFYSIVEKRTGVAYARSFLVNGINYDSCLSAR